MPVNEAPTIIPERLAQITALMDSGPVDGRATSIPVEVRFWSQVKPSPIGCWEWQGRIDENGYGRSSIGFRHSVGAHRVAWELAFGAPDQHVLHRCDNPRCCNPSHLFLGSNHDNVLDRHAKGRSKNLDRGEDHPKAKLTAEQASEMRALRSQGWTQVQLANRFNISRGNVSKIVAGRSY